MGNRTRSRQTGFTVMELMIAVAIVGVLSMLAVPTFAKYKAKVRFTEASQMFSTMFKGEASLYNVGIENGGTSLLNGHAYGSCVIPASYREPTNEAYVPGAQDNCPLLNVSPRDPIYFLYMASPQGSGFTKDWDYINFAWEDLDGDGQVNAYAEAIGSRSGELYRAGRFSQGDQDNIVYGWAASLSEMPSQPGGPGK